MLVLTSSIAGCQDEEAKVSELASQIVVHLQPMIQYNGDSFIHSSCLSAFIGFGHVQLNKNKAGGSFETRQSTSIDKKATTNVRPSLWESFMISYDLGMI